MSPSPCPLVPISGPRPSTFGGPENVVQGQTEKSLSRTGFPRVGRSRLAKCQVQRARLMLSFMALASIRNQCLRPISRPLATLHTSGVFRPSQVVTCPQLSNHRRRVPQSFWLRMPQPPVLSWLRVHRPSTSVLLKPKTQRPANCRQNRAGVRSPSTASDPLVCSTATGNAWLRWASIASRAVRRQNELIRALFCAIVAEP